MSSAVPSSLPGAPRVLLVEDHVVNVQVLVLMLRQMGCSIEVAKDGETAVARAREGFELILMDCGLPGMDGYEAARHIRRSGGAWSRTPIVAVTAYAAESDRARALAAGMNDWLPKPIARDELAVVLQKHLGWGPPPPLASAEPDVDLRVIGELIELALPDDPEFFTRLVASFREASVRSVTEIERLLAEGEAVDGRRHLHRLRSAASTVGAMRLREFSGRMERESDERLLEGYGADCASLRELVERSLVILGEQAGASRTGVAE